MTDNNPIAELVDAMTLHHGYLAALFACLSMLSNIGAAEIALKQQSTLGTGGKVTLQWGFDIETIRFKVTAETLGWVGIGFSKTGSMKQSDIVFMWTKEGEGRIVDMHAHQNGLPNVDDSQDYVLDSATEKAGTSTFDFSRKLKHCDQYDSDMKEHTYRVIWAIGDHDPDGEVVTVDEYHGGQNRGVQSLKIMNTVPERPNEDSTHQDDLVMSYDIAPVRLQVPARTTYYHCKMFKIPELKGKHHIIEYDPIITAGNEKKVHHITVHACKLPGDASFSEEGGECYRTVRPFALGCAGVPMSYAIGSTSIIYPPNVGYPIGEADEPQYLLLETHYNNPEAKVFTDSSGIRMYYTSKLRKVDAGIMVVGYVTSTTMAIPPGSKDFAVQGHCLEQCLSQAFSNESEQEMTLIAGGLHAHEAGRKLSLRHFREGVELKPIMKDDWFDVEFQEGQYMSEEVTIRSGDRLMVQCDYDTTERKSVTSGGLSIKDEMCTAYIAYYPRIDLSLCMSSISAKSFLESFDVKNTTEFLTKLPKMEWNSQSINDFNKKTLQSNINPLCQGSIGFYTNYSQEVQVPTTTEEYTDAQPECGSALGAHRMAPLLSLVSLYHAVTSVI